MTGVSRAESTRSVPQAVKIAAVLGWLSGLLVVVGGLMALMGQSGKSGHPAEAALVLGFGLVWVGLGWTLYRQPNRRAVSLGALLALVAVFVALVFSSVWSGPKLRWGVLAWWAAMDLVMAHAFVRIVIDEERRADALPRSAWTRWLYLFGAAQTNSLSNSFSIAWRELKRYFRSPASYVILAAFFLYQGLIFYIAVRYLNDPNAPHGAPMKFFFGGPFWFWPLECFIIAIITMDTLTEEQVRRTIEPMMTAPVHEAELVVGKFLGALGYFVFLWVGTFVYVLMLAAHAEGVSHASVVRFGLMGGWVGLWILLAVAMRRGGASGLVAWVGLAVAALVAARGSEGIGFGTAVKMLLVTGLPAGALLVKELWKNKDSELLHMVLALAAGVGFVLAGWYWFGLGGHLFHEAGRNAPNLGPVLSGYLGAIGIGAAGIALGILYSSLTRDPKLATMLTFISLFLLIIVKIMLLPEVNIIETGWVRNLMTHLNFFDYMYDFSRGIVDTRHLTLLGSVVVFCLYAASRAVQVLKWR